MTLASAASGTVPREHRSAIATDLAALKERRPGAWTELFEHAYPLVFRVALTTVGDRAAAEDIASQVFLDAIAGIRRYRDRGRPVTAWLLVITRHRCADWFRERRRQPLPMSDDIVAAPDAGITEVARLLAVLTSEQREVVHLRFVEDLAVEDVARVTGRTPGAVKSLQHRAMARLRVFLENDQRKEMAI